MNDRLANIRELFIEALDRDGLDAQLQFVSGRCADESLKAELEQMLRAHNERGFLESSPGDVDSVLNSTHELPSAIGPYQVREQIGEGGMGIVYVAEQSEPVQRKVALKIIKPGMDTKEVIARFEAERQALAFMEHPNIARVLDAGATESGRSYFVMELVRGIPITEYCDQVKTTPRERLELFQTVCDAVQHAHQKGIIHRDIKPSNVLVTQVSAKPVVKVIDFGLAKAVSGQKLTEKTLYTGFMKLMGTPAYMSPEQAGLSGLDVDTRSDIFSLGVLLYELLTGTTPLDKTVIKEHAYDELCRQIREVDAPKPSTRFSTLQDAQRSTIAEHRQVDSRELRQLLHGDLDRVVLKAIEKDRERRYASPQDLAADIDRFLDDKPVLAVPPSQWYLARKYLRRHKTAIVTAATILSVLLLATALSTWQAIHLAKANKTVTLERNAARLAEDEAVTSKRIADAAREASRVSEQQAQASARNERRLRYAANLQLADQLYHSEDGTPEQIEKLLAAWIPSDNEPDDMRELAWRFQWSRLHLSSHKMMEGVNTLTFSPAGNLVLADKSGIREWDPSTRSFSPRWQGDASKGGRQVALSDCGRWAAVRDDSIVRLIELASGESIGEAPGTHARFATGGEYLLVWRIDPEQREPVEHRVWNTKTNISRPLEAELRALGSKSGYENSSSISPDGRSFTFESANGMALEFHVTGRDVPFRFVGDGAGYAAWSPNGQLLAVGRGPGLLVIRRIDDPERNVQLNTGRGGSRSLAFTSDSMQLAVGSGGTVDFYDLAHLYDANAGDETPTMHFAAPPKRVRTVHAHIGAVEKIAFSKDGKFMATVDADRTAKLWQVDQISNALPLLSQPDFPNEGVSGIAVEDFEGGVRVSYVEPFCKASGDFHIGDKILSIAEGGKTQEISRKADANDVRGLLLGAPDSVFEVQLASQSSNETPIIQVTRQKIETLAKTTSAYRMAPARNPNEIIVCSRYGSYRRNLQGNITQYYPAKGPSLVETSPDRKLLAYIERKELVLRDLVNNQEFRRLPACVGVHPTPIDVSSIGGVVSFSPDERFIAVGTGWPFNTSFPERRSDLMVWDTSTFEKIGDPLFENLVGISGVTFSPDSDYLVATDHNGVVRIWRTSDWELVDTLQGLNTASVATSFSPDGEFLGQGGYSGIVVWDFHSRRKLMTNRNRSAVDLEFSQEGTLVTIGLDGRANMWDIHTGMKLTSMKMGPDKLLDCDFTPDRKKLVILGRRDSLWAYDIAPLNEIDQHRLTIAALERRGLSQQQDGMFSKAEGTYRRILRIQKVTLPPGHAGLAETRAKLVNALQQQGEFPSITSHPKTKRVALGEDVTLKVECSHAGETDWTYQWYFKNEPIENATSSSLRIPNVTADDQGVYFVKASCKGDEDLGTIVHTSEVAFIADSKASVVRGGLKKESFFNIESKSLSALRAAKAFPRHPDAIGVIDAFEVPRNVADNYGLRLTGFIVPPKSGNYVFYLCSDDDSELFLSSDETSENRQSIARLSRIRKPREWKTSRAEGISESIRLEAGKRYWVEAHFKEGRGDDHFAVTWQMPDEPPPKIGDPPIPGEFLEFQIE